MEEEYMDILAFQNKYDYIIPTTHIKVVIKIRGRVMNRREDIISDELYFDIVSGRSKLCISLKSSNYESNESLEKMKEKVREGDIVKVEGYAAYMTIIPIEITVLVPCLLNIQRPNYNVQNKETRYRNRYLDLVMNESVVNIFFKRAQIIKYVEAFLEKHGCLKVETPTLHLIPACAAALPFITHHKDFDMKMYLRNTPELFLKQLLVGGIERVYEIGKQFRNDLTHNSEFTTCEAYITGADYNTWMNFTESVLSGMVKKFHKSYKVNYTSLGKKFVIDYSTPFLHIDLMLGLEKELGQKLPAATELDTNESRVALDQICTDRNIDCSGARTSARLLDKLVGRYLESKCINPTFIINYPDIISSLTKYRSQRGLTEQSKLFVMKTELVNACTELNDYHEQRSRFQQHAKDRAAVGDESMFIDENFMDALAYGLPSCGGWWLDIDRLVMLMTNTESIGDVIIFPTMKMDNAMVPTYDAKEN